MADKLIYEDQKDALSLMTIIKEKRCGKIKASACAYGRKQDADQKMK